MTAQDPSTVTPSVTLDAPAGGYQTGATATLTVVRPLGVLSAAVDILGVPEIVASSTFPVPAPVTDKSSIPHAWTKVSDDGVTAKYTTTV